MFAIDDSASIFCARLIRGIISIATTVVPFSAASFILASSATGLKKEISVWSDRIIAISAVLGTRTLATTSAVSQSSAAVSITSTPASTYLSLEKPAASPAPASIRQV